jgi:hypothetical protein
VVPGRLAGRRHRFAAERRAAGSHDQRAEHQRRRRQRGDVVASPHLSSSERSIDRWFNTGFVTRSAPGVFGNAGRNLVEGPSRRNIDIMVARNFMMPWEGHTLQFRFESFNFTNTPAFGQPNTAVGTPNVGLINEADDPRRIQFALKYVF